MCDGHIFAIYMTNGHTFAIFVTYFNKITTDFCLLKGHMVIYLQNKQNFRSERAIDEK